MGGLIGREEGGALARCVARAANQQKPTLRCNALAMPCELNFLK
jgi:hypothetical protein